MTCTKIFMQIKICLILVNIEKIQSFITKKNKKVIGNMKDETESVRL